MATSFYDVVILGQDLAATVAGAVLSHRGFRVLVAGVPVEERYSLGQLAEVVPEDPGDRDPVEFFSTGVRTFLEAVLSRPATWRLILLPLEGTPEIVRDHVDENRQRMGAICKKDCQPDRCLCKPMNCS